MKSQLQVSIIQADLFWEDKSANLQQFEEKIQGISSTDVIILPEMFTTGFTMNPKPLAEKMNGKTVHWMLQMASQKKSLVIGSIIIDDNAHYYNRLIAAFPDGSIQFYDKKHLFTLANEHHFYQAGNQHLLIEYLGWKIFPLICYDLRFPVWARNTHDYDVLIYIASWPKPRIFAWDILLKARAIENMAYTIGVNRVGVDANGFEYPGHSVVLDAYGNEMSSEMENLSFVKTTILDKEKQNLIRKKLQFLNDKDTFTIL
ncbi:MAG: amidohydrolase [Flavobacteriaceae bacterium]|jgi:predicted amidohydrolase|nr:amidohydrolase [Flavobacteriaceae bacterium]